MIIIRLQEVKIMTYKRRNYDILNWNDDLSWNYVKMPKLWECRNDEMKSHNYDKIKYKKTHQFWIFNVIIMTKVKIITWMSELWHNRNYNLEVQNDVNYKIKKSKLWQIKIKVIIMR